MFLTFDSLSLDKKIDVKEHPKYMVVFNDVSKHGDDFDPNQVLKNPDYVPQIASSSLSKQHRIEKFKTQLKDAAKKFYLFEKVSDESVIG